MHADGALGVYGLAVTGLGDVSRYAGCPLPGSPRLDVRVVRAQARYDVQSRLFDDRAVIPLVEGGVLEVTREPAVATFALAHELTDDELLHPWLVPAAATVAAWHGRRVLHGGVVVQGGRAVAVVGDKEGGKSTLLAHLAFEPGVGVMSDDLVVTDGHTVFAGPRCIDLRPGSVPHLPAAGGARLVRDRTRLRVELPQTPDVAELVGLVVLAWGDETGVTPVRPGERLREVLPHALTEGIDPGNGAGGVLGFASYPMWRLSRPRRWDALAPSADLVRGLLA